MSKCCSGCGVVLQNDDPKKIGYTPKMEAALCQRCFRIRHYGDHMISMRQGIDSEQVLNKIKAMDALILWVVDLFDLEANMIKGMNRHLANKDIIMIATKRDLLPDTLSDHKLGTFLIGRLKEWGIHLKQIVLCGGLHEKEESSVEEIKYNIEKYRNCKDVVVMGMANAGKSTMLNAICDHIDLTCSLHPGTTLDFSEIKMDGYSIYDTPGLTRKDSLLTNIDDKLLKEVVPLKPIKPRIYQIYEPQSFALAGLVRIDLDGVKTGSVVIYASNQVNIHRGKLRNADELWEKHYGGLLSPTLSNYDEMKTFTYHNVKNKVDIVIHGLGWICISGDIKDVKVKVCKESSVTFRKGMI